MPKLTTYNVHYNPDTFEITSATILHKTKQKNAIFVRAETTNEAFRVAKIALEYRKIEDKLLMNRGSSEKND